MEWNLEKLKKPSKHFLLTAPFDKICRICLFLQQGEEMCNLFEVTHEDTTLYKMFANYISVEVEQNDDLPQNICKSCKTDIVRIYMLIQQCRESDALLRSILDERGKIPEVHIKVVLDEARTSTQEDIQRNELSEVVLNKHNQEISVLDSETVYPFLSLNQKKDHENDDMTLLCSPKSDHYDDYVDIKNELEPEISIKQEDHCIQNDECSTNSSSTVTRSNKSPMFWYSCNDCKESFETFNELKQHRKQAKHPRPRNHVCSKCKKAFISHGHLQQHMASHASENPRQNSYTEAKQDDVKNDLSKVVKNLLESDKPHSTVHPCKKCNKMFATHNELKMHWKQAKHSQPCNYVCPKCCKPVKTSHNFKQHMKTHTLESNLKTAFKVDDQNINDDVTENKICLPELSSSLSNSERFFPSYDENTQNDDSSKLLHSCKQCNKTFDSYNKLKLHWKEVKHPQPRNHVCTECKKSFISNSKLQQHIRTHTKEKPYSCHICQMQFSASGSLRRHMMQHTGERPHVCEFCGKGFIQVESLVEHRRLHTGEMPFMCTYCGRCFKHRMSYKSHLQVHFIESESSGNNQSSNLSQNNQCDICQRKFTTKGILKTHMLIHGEKKFLCNQCGKGFASKGGLLTHMKVHTGDKPYACKECNKAFSQIGALKSHTRIHTGEKPFACKLCPKAFAISHHLGYHMRTHSKEKPFKCSYCGKLFAYKANLTVHVRIHTGETPFVCNICGKGFYHSNNMKKHRKVHEKLNEKVVSEAITMPYQEEDGS